MHDLGSQKLIFTLLDSISVQLSLYQLLLLPTVCLTFYNLENVDPLIWIFILQPYTAGSCQNPYNSLPVHTAFGSISPGINSISCLYSCYWRAVTVSHLTGEWQVFLFLLLFTLLTKYFLLNSCHMICSYLVLLQLLT